MKGSEMKSFTAFELKTPELADLAKTLDPKIKDYDYENTLHGSFLVIGLPKPGVYTVMTPAQVGEHFDHIENGMPITLKLIVAKEL
jgi:hypothetical protein